MKERWIPYYWSGRDHFPNHSPFAWIIKDVLGVSCWPDSEHFTKEYPNNNIKVVINVSEFDIPEGVPDGYDYYHIPIPDYGTPTENQIKEFLNITHRYQQKKEPIVVHCVAGCGRTGQMVSIWSAANGYLPDNEDPIQWIRKRRPCSCETREQERLVKKWVNQYRSQ